MRFRGIDGFVAAISPFNFTAIGGNLAYTPALMVGTHETLVDFIDCYRNYLFIG